MAFASRLISALLAALLFGAATLLHAQINPGENATDSATPKNSAIAPIADVAGLPRVLIIGDSVSIGYTLGVRALLKGKAARECSPFKESFNKLSPMDEDDLDDGLIFVSLHLHIIFSTKKQEPVIDDYFRNRVWGIIGDIIRENRGRDVSVGGTADHIHFLVSPPATISVEDLVQRVKKGSAQWIHETLPEMKKFAWQEGYAAFSVSEDDLKKVTKYINNQEKHHRKIDFKDEYRALLIENEIEFDEKDLFD